VCAGRAAGSAAAAGCCSCTITDAAAEIGADAAKTSVSVRCSTPGKTCSTAADPRSGQRVAPDGRAGAISAWPVTQSGPATEAKHRDLR
jgi:hypothetical protein